MILTLKLSQVTIILFFSPFFFLHFSRNYKFSQLTRFMGIWGLDPYHLKRFPCRILKLGINGWYRHEKVSDRSDGSESIDRVNLWAWKIVQGGMDPLDTEHHTTSATHYTDNRSLRHLSGSQMSQNYARNMMIKWLFLSSPFLFLQPSSSVFYLAVNTPYIASLHI